jgi:hypothetical protein
MKITPKIIGASLMFACIDGDKTRTNPPVATLANLRALMATKNAEVLTHQQAHQDAHSAIRAALKGNRPTAAARAQVTAAEALITAGMAEVNELQDLIDQVTSATIEHNAKGFTQAAQSVIDTSLAAFDLSQLESTAP